MNFCYRQALFLFFRKFTKQRRWIIQRDRNCSNFIISYNNGEREIRRFQVRSRKYALYNVSFFDRIKEQTKCFTNFRSIIVFPFVRSIISHRGVSIERRLKRISSIGATLIYIGVHRNSDHSKIKRVEREKNDSKSPRTFSLRIKEERELLEFREIDELLCRDPESSIETEKKKNRVPEISITGEGKSDNVARFRYNGASTNLPQNNTSLRDRVQAWLHLTQEWRIERVKFFRWNLYPCFTGIYRNFIWIKLSFQLTPLNFVLDIFCK